MPALFILFGYRMRVRRSISVVAVLVSMFAVQPVLPHIS